MKIVLLLILMTLSGCSTIDKEDYAFGIELSCLKTTLHMYNQYKLDVTTHAKLEALNYCKGLYKEASK